MHQPFGQVPSAPAAVGGPEFPGGPPPRAVEFVQGVHPWLGGFLLLMGFLPAVVGLLADDPKEQGWDGGASLLMLLPPMLMWSLWMGAVAWGALVVPLRARHLARHGDILAGTVLQVETIPKTGGSKVTYAYTPRHATAPLQGSFTRPAVNFFSKPQETLHSGSTLLVAYAPRSPQRHVVLQQSAYLPVALIPAQAHHAPVLPAVVAFILCVATSFKMGMDEMEGIRDIRHEAAAGVDWVLGSLVVLLLLGVVRLRWRLSSGTPARVLVWEALLLVSLGLVLVSGTMVANHVLESAQVEAQLRVRAHVCLQVKGATRMCLMELVTPTAPPHVVVVQAALAQTPAEEEAARKLVGTLVPLMWRSGGLGTPYIQAVDFEAREWVRFPPVAAVDGLRFGKTETLEGVAKAHQLQAFGRFAPGSILAQQLGALDIPLKER